MQGSAGAAAGGAPVLLFKPDSIPRSSHSIGCLVPRPCLPHPPVSLRTVVLCPRIPSICSMCQVLHLLQAYFLWPLLLLLLLLLLCRSSSSNSSSSGSAASDGWGAAWWGVGRCSLQCGQSLTLPLICQLTCVQVSRYVCRQCVNNTCVTVDRGVCVFVCVCVAQQ